MTPSLPNILVIMSDQHRADLLGCAGDPAVQTPNLDRLAAEGVRFTRVNCQGPLCMPARASFLTERYVRDHGVYSNWAAVAPDSPTYLKALRESGYHTAMIGKAHLYRDEAQGMRHADEFAPSLKRLGFTEVEESGDKFSADASNRYTDFLGERDLLDVYRRHITDRSYQGENESGAGATKRVPMWDSTPLPIPLDAYIDAWQGRQAVRWIERYNRDKPFFAFVGFPGPHDPWDAPQAAVDRYAAVEISMPRSTRRPKLDGTGTYGRLLGAFLNLSDTDTMTDDAIRGMRRAYCADITVIDDAIGRIRAALEARDLLRKTWIIYTSDHGEMGGNHGLMSKCVFYEPAVRVPLIIRPPAGCDPLVVGSLVEHLDVPATLREIAGAPDVAASEGRSLLGHLSNDRAQARELSISENWGFALFETERYKLVVDEDALSPCQLFDLLHDPCEDENRVADPECSAVVDEMMETMVRPFFTTAPARPHQSPFTG